MLRFAHRMGWVEESVPDSIVLPKRDGKSRDRSIDPDRVGALLDELEKYRYASLDHVIMSMLWTTGMRIGTLRGLDVKDVHLDERWVNISHRPEGDTPLKNLKTPNAKSTCTGGYAKSCGRGSTTGGQ
ncbi:tyrosine-type recombinase/integrase [Halomicroarcula sp. GCM10025710]